MTTFKKLQALVVQAAVKEFQKALMELNWIMGGSLEKSWQLTAGRNASPWPDSAFDYSLARARFEHLRDGGGTGLLNRVGGGSNPAAVPGSMPAEAGTGAAGGAASV